MVRETGGRSVLSYLHKSLFTLEELVSLPDDTEDDRVRKATLSIISILIGIAGLLWSGMYLLLGFKVSAIFPFAYSFLVGMIFLIFLKTKNFLFFLNLQLILILWLPVLLQWSLGGFANSGSVMIWSFLAPLGAIIFHDLKKSYLWFIAFIVLLLISVFSDQYWEQLFITPQRWQVSLFFTMNVGVVSLITFSALVFFLEQLKKSTTRLGEKKEQLEVLAGKLAKFLSPQVYSSIFSGKQDVKIETHRRRLTIFFSDIVGFTDITDTLEAESLSELLNDYLNEMANISQNHGGTIDKFMGDAVMIFFGDPETHGAQKDAISCVSMAIEMRNKMENLRDKWIDQGITKPLHIRIGINSGYCTVGNFGSDERIDYTIIGGQVNLASRLESSAIPDQILISQETYDLIKEKVYCEKKDSITVKGVSHPVQTYQVIDFTRQVKTSDSTSFRKHGQGYSISLDYDRITDKEKRHLVNELQQIQNKILNK